ncbi:aldehyde dehydrogenase family protein [Acrocarpospora sp. B8E8]|uniref:aldehyde dehydrogenase family protein n=1 Tax=Acrocarpospora sp. B8E8 TaxID=3153572 RepID=UPI00325CC0C5
MIGIPDDRRQEVVDAAHAMIAWGDDDTVAGSDSATEMLNGLVTLHGVCQDVIDMRREKPENGLISALIAAEVDGQHLTDDEIRAFFVLLCAAGNDTTKQTTTHTLRALTENPGQRDWLMADFDARIGPAVEEFVRWASPVMTFRRTPLERFELNGTVIEPGDKVAMFYSSGNRDESIIDRPREFDITRKPGPHVAFGGGGPHYCLGSHLAKAQLRSIFRELYTQLPDATQDLLAQAMDHVIFTGGPEIGKRVAAPHLTPVTLELGGKSPAVVARDADIPVAARRIAWVKLLNSGQTCIAPDYVLVDASVREEFLGALEKTIEEFQVGEPAGRIIDERQFDRVSALLDGHGGTVVRGGTRDRATLTIDPAVELDPAPDSPLMREEIFGPVLPVVTVESLDDAIRRINSGPKPLAAYLFGSSRTDRERLVNETSSGGVVINHAAMHCLVPQLPFGRVGNSGMGAYHGKWGFETFSHRKAVLVKPAKPDPSLMYPPYTVSKKKLMRRFF